MATESLVLVPLIPTQALELNLVTNIRNLTLARDKVAVGDPATGFLIKPNADGSLNVVDLSGSGGIAQMDLSAFVEATTFFTPIGGERQDLTIVIPNGKAGVARLTPFRGIHINLRDNAGNEIGTVLLPVVVTGTKTNNTAAPGANNVGVLPAVANAASPAYIEGDQVLESVDLTGRQRSRGTLTHNSAAPTADNLGALAALANAVAPVLIEGDQVLLSSDLKGNLRNQEYRPDTALVTPVPGAVVSTTLAAANTARRGFFVFNDTNKVMYLKYGAAASTVSYTTQVDHGAFYEMPFPIYTGIVTAIWTAGIAGNALVTELS